MKPQTTARSLTFGNSLVDRFTTRPILFNLNLLLNVFLATDCNIPVKKNHTNPHKLKDFWSIIFFFEHLRFCTHMLNAADK